MKISGWFLGAAAGVILAGCGSTQPAITSSVGSSPAFPSTASALSESQFLELAREIPFFADGSSNPQSFATALCAVFDPSRGGDPGSLWREAVGASIGAGLDAKDAGSFLTYAVATYCPQEYRYLPGA